MKPAFASDEGNRFSSAISHKLNIFATSGFIIAILAALASSSKAILVKLLYAEIVISPINLLMLRLAISLPFFIYLLRFYPRTSFQKQTAKNQFKSMVLVIWLGFCGYYLASLTDFIGLQTISANLERLVLFTYPAIVLVIEAIILKRIPTRYSWMGIAISYLGVLIAFGYDVSQLTDSSDIVSGVCWVFLSGFSFALYYLGSGAAVKAFGARCFVGLAGISATFFTFIHYMQSEQTLLLSDLSLTSWINISLLALVCTILPSLLLAVAIQRIGASATARIGMVGPMITMLLGWWILGEVFSIYQLIGLVLVVVGISQVNRRN